MALLIVRSHLASHCMKHPPQRDWLGVTIQAVFGVLVGAVVGFSSWLSRNNRHPGAADLVFMVGLCAIVGGILAGWLGDRLWLGENEGFLNYRRPRNKKNGRAT